MKMLIKRSARTDTVGVEDGNSLMEVALILGHVSVYQYFGGTNSAMKGTEPKGASSHHFYLLLVFNGAILPVSYCASQLVKA